MSEDYSGQGQEALRKMIHQDNVDNFGMSEGPVVVGVDPSAGRDAAAMAVVTGQGIDPEVMDRLRKIASVNGIVLLVGEPESPVAKLAELETLKQNRARAIEIVNNVLEEKNQQMASNLYDQDGKIDPFWQYLGAAFDDVTERWYACVMTRDENPQAKEPYYLLSKRKYGFDTAFEAKMEAGRDLPQMPIISDDGASFDYPYWIEKSEIPAYNKAERKRRRQVLKLKLSNGTITPEERTELEGLKTL